MLTVSDLTVSDAPFAKRQGLTGCHRVGAVPLLERSRRVSAGGLSLIELAGHPGEGWKQARCGTRGDEVKALSDVTSG